MFFSAVFFFALFLIKVFAKFNYNACDYFFVFIIFLFNLYFHYPSHPLVSRHFSDSIELDSIKVQGPDNSLSSLETYETPFPRWKNVSPGFYLAAIHFYSVAVLLARIRRITRARSATITFNRRAIDNDNSLKWARAEENESARCSARTTMRLLRFGIRPVLNEVPSPFPPLPPLSLSSSRPLIPRDVARHLLIEEAAGCENHVGDAR